MTALGGSDGKKFARNLHRTQLGKNANFIERDSYQKTIERKNNKRIFWKYRRIHLYIVSYLGNSNYFYYAVLIENKSLIYGNADFIMFLYLIKYYLLNLYNYRNGNYI